MKTIKIIASSFLIFTLNVHAFEMDTSVNSNSSIETRKDEITSVMSKNGRNNYLKAHQDKFAIANDNKAISNSTLPKGRNLDTIDNKSVASSSYAKTGRNKSANNEMVSMY